MRLEFKNVTDVLTRCYDDVENYEDTGISG